jgi:Putative lumazine-binding
MNDMKLITLLFLFVVGVAQAQTDVEGMAIMKPITTLFTGMNLGDSAMVHSAFTADATMASIGKDKVGKVTVRRESSLSGFLKAVGSPHKEPWSEPIWDARIEVDGDFAQVWTQYAFYAGKSFSHCGVDAFQLVKIEGVWKIFHLVDTRRKDDCSIPKSISDQFK